MLVIQLESLLMLLSKAAAQFVQSIIVVGQEAKLNLPLTGQDSRVPAATLCIPKALGLPLLLLLFRLFFS